MSTVFHPELTRVANNSVSHHAGQGEAVFYDMLVRHFWLDEEVNDTEAKDASGSAWPAYCLGRQCRLTIEEGCPFTASTACTLQV